MPYKSKYRRQRQQQTSMDLEQKEHHKKKIGNAAEKCQPFGRRDFQLLDDHVMLEAEFFGSHKQFFKVNFIVLFHNKSTIKRSILQHLFYQLYNYLLKEF